MNSDKKILLVGECVLDIIQEVNKYPGEDDDVRSVNAFWQRGGNASNMATVLTNLNRKCELLTTFSNDKTFNFVIDDLNERGIDIKNCYYHPNCSVPFSTVILSRNTGCRTIVHSNKNLPHVNFDNFDKCNLSEYRWVHFEARSVPETTKMMQKIRKFNESQSAGDRITISLELEKKRDENLLLIKFADVAILGRDYAEILDCYDKKTAIFKLKKLTMEDERYKNDKIMLVCPWGSDGAIALNPTGGYCESPVYPPEKVVDTLGAGDTFAAGLIDSLLDDFDDIQRAIVHGCKIAGEKCGSFGYDCIKNIKRV